VSRAVLLIRVWSAYETTRVITHVNDGMNSNIHIASFVRVSPHGLFLLPRVCGAEKSAVGGRGAIVT